ncbi:hypothetical protein [Tropicimonas sp. IMCC6043]|uniref:hypothetical protein n=1 Tax=Tropicimonas sp. IMCC6043 TaxID=2510645 RepID=UPI00101B69AA|nr:hypothetical protein [Tropicimonas sp. IMCC6043]RYH06099.1 hypothetical protein EU800_24985 [Tropicimonas sp. IMCC6043]
MAVLNPLLQVSPFASDGGELIGRDPREIPAVNWIGHPLLIGLKAIRSKCLDCAMDAKEVRKCSRTDCPLWPLRMGTVPKGFNLARQGAGISGPACTSVATPDAVEADENPACAAVNDGERAI